MLRSPLSRRGGKALAAASIGLAVVAPVLALSTPAGATAKVAPVVSSLATSTGSTSGGTVVINGTNLNGTKDGTSVSVLFGYIPATIVSTTASALTVTAPAEAPGNVNVVVTYTTAPGKKAKYTSPSLPYTFVAPPTTGTPVVAGLSPTSGAFVGGNAVTITGANLGSATSVSFGSTAVTSFTSDTASQIVVNAPEATASGAVDVTVTTAQGTSGTGNSGDKYTYGPNTTGALYLPPASLIIGSGSATTYSTMVGLADLFGAAPGCDLTNTSVNQLALQCSNAAGTFRTSDTPDTGSATANDGEAGLPVGDINPLNDYVANAPATGSGNGRSELTTSNPLIAGPVGLTGFNTSYARSSSFSANTALNYVGWGTDGVTWSSATQVNGAATGHAAVNNISKADLVALWNGTLNCTINGVNYHEAWNCLEQDAGVAPETTADPVDCYTTQTASGTYSTWQGFLGFTKNVAPGCSTSANEAGDAGGTDANAQTVHTNLTENQWSSISTETVNNDTANAIYFFSYGKFTTVCNTPGTVTTTTEPSEPSGGIYTGVYQANCDGTPANDLFNVGQINGVQPDEHTIQGNGDQTGVTFPDPRILYNAYANSTAPQPANASTLNFVGSTGWLCRNTVPEIDPTTGISYRTEIESVIRSNGFFPIDILSGGVPQTFAQVDLNHIPANEVGTGTYYPGDTLSNNLGFCFNSGAGVGTP